MPLFMLLLRGTVVALGLMQVQVERGVCRFDV